MLKCELELDTHDLVGAEWIPYVEITNLEVVSVLRTPDQPPSMFTGIVEERGEVVAVREDDGGRRLRIAADEVGEDLAHGQSISVSGVCLTVEDWGPVADLDVETAAGDTWFEVFLTAETLEVTYLGEVGVGHVVNLERAMPADGRLDGHVVQGHVDATTEVVEIERVGEREARSASNGPSGDDEEPRDDWRFTFAVPPGYGKYVAKKGSVALDGVSLTVAERNPETFESAVIPTTYDLTNFGEKEPGDPVHLEVDVLARYAERLLDERERAEVPVRGESEESAAIEGR